MDDDLFDAQLRRQMAMLEAEEEEERARIEAEGGNAERKVDEEQGDGRESSHSALSLFGANDGGNDRLDDDNAGALEEAYRVIEVQRQQIERLTQRVSTLEEQAGREIVGGGGSRDGVVADSDRVVALRRKVAEQAQELARLRAENAVLRTSGGKTLESVRSARRMAPAVESDESDEVFFDAFSGRGDAAAEKSARDSESRFLRALQASAESGAPSKIASSVGNTYVMQQKEGVFSGGGGSPDGGARAGTMRLGEEPSVTAARREREAQQLSRDPYRPSGPGPQPSYGTSSSTPYQPSRPYQPTPYTPSAAPRYVPPPPPPPPAAAVYGGARTPYSRAPVPTPSSMMRSPSVPRGMSAASAPRRAPPPRQNSMESAVAVDSTAPPDAIRAKQWFEQMLQGVEVIKHCGFPGTPHAKTLWLDLSDPFQPAFRWNKPPGTDQEKAKTLMIREIQRISKGMSTPKLKRYGNESHAGRYISFIPNVDDMGRGGEQASLDFEFDSEQDRDWFFDAVIKCFGAFRDAYQAGLDASGVIDFVRRRVDG